MRIRIEPAKQVYAFRIQKNRAVRVIFKRNKSYELELLFTPTLTSKCGGLSPHPHKGARVKLWSLRVKLLCYLVEILTERCKSQLHDKYKHLRQLTDSKCYLSQNPEIYEEEQHQEIHQVQLLHHEEQI